MKKHNNSPIGKVKNTEMAKKRRAEAEARCMARITEKLIRSGATPEEVEELMTKDDLRSILCIYYGNHTVDIGEQETTKKKWNKETKKLEEVKVTKRIILRGRQAAEYSIREKNLEVIAFANTHCFIKTNKENAEKIAEDLRATIGRCYITKHKRLPAKETVENIEKSPEKEKTPTNNTVSVRETAKKKRKKENKKKVEMRPYYAAYRKGGVSARIKKYNKTLADKIEKWLEERKAAEAKKEEANKEYRAKHRQLTSFEMKANKRARKAAKHLATQERRREREKKRMEDNAKMAAKRAKKAQKPVQTELNMAA